jgi:hypothetical protein
MKRPGRPPLDQDDRSVPVTFSLPSRQLAVVSKHAKHDRLTVQDWIRRVVRDAADTKISIK